MKKLVLLLLLSSYSFITFSQSTIYANAWTNKEGTMIVEYLDNFPYSYKDASGELTGIEIDMIKEFTKWLKQKKGIDLVISYNEYSDFSKFYNSVRTTKNVAIGAGSVTITSDRSKDVKFSSPYLKNKPILVSSINKATLTDIRNISKDFAGMTAVIVKGSIHDKWINQIKADYWKDLKVEYVESPKVVLEKISSGGNYFGYVDLVTYWASLKQESYLLKMHRINTGSSEYFAFIFPKGSDWVAPFSEFFDSGMGFPGTKKYMEILRKHLGEELIDAVAIQY